MRLEGKVALITGGTSGIGRATALRFAAEGAAVAITGRNIERGEQVVQEIKAKRGEALFIRSDVRNATDCRQAVEQTLKRFGKIDVLFNNAGVFHPKTVPDCSEEEWDETIDSSLKGAFLMSKYVLPSMIERRSGSIMINGREAVALPPRGNTSLAEGWELLLKVVGLKLDDLGTKSYGSITENGELIKNRQAVAMGWYTVVPASFVLDVGSSRKLRMVGLTEDTIKKMQALNAGFIRHVVPKGTYGAYGI